MHGEQLRAKRVKPGELLDWRAAAAVAHVALRLQPVVETLGVDEVERAGGLAAIGLE